MTIAVTGGTGFVGGYVISEALHRGLNVRAMVRTPEKARLQHENLQWIKGSLGSDDSELLKGADVVIHLAGLIKARNLDSFMAVNATAAGALAEAAQKAEVKRFVLLSSQVAQNPYLSDYARSKKSGEDLVRDAFERNLSIIRAPAVIGPGDEATAPFFAFIQRGILPVPGGRNWRSRRLAMVYVKDLARYIVDTALRKGSMADFSVPATLPDVTWPEFAKLWGEAAGRPVKAMPIPLSVLYPVAQITSLTSSLFGIGHLTRQKLREFLHADWSSEQLIPDATPPIDALKITLQSYQNDQED